MICGAQAARELSRAGVLEPITMVIRGHKACAMSERYNIVVEDDKQNLENLRRNYYAPIRRGSSGIT
jgi:hypothetical protein